MNVIRAVSGKYELVANGETVAMAETVFTLNAVDRVAYRAGWLKINGSYMGTDDVVELAQADTRRAFLLTSGRRDENLDYSRDAWFRLVDLLETTVCPRLAMNVISEVERGDTVKLGLVAVSSAGVRRRQKLFSTLVPWSEVTGTEIGAKQIKVLGRDAKVVLAAETSAFNAVLLPRVVKHFAR